jgi:hypothetical protein
MLFRLLIVGLLIEVLEIVPPAGPLTLDQERETIEPSESVADPEREAELVGIIIA